MLELNKVICGDCLEEIKKLEDNSVDAVITDPPYGLSFMGKKWDYDVPSQEIWEECLRVLKPGGYLLSFAGTRTQHRMAVRIEDAGFEIRDMIAWVYGSGFPKSLNIGKAVDKLQGNEREFIGIDDNGCNPNYKCSSEDSKHIEITKGTSEWEGWGTALKPALEPITVARKPLSEKTVALNCLKWGVGGINIDGCRVGTEGGTAKGTFPNEDSNGIYGNGLNGSCEIKDIGAGRFPANLIHSGEDEVVSLFPNDSQRFFYSPKASKSERNRGCEGLPDVNWWELNEGGGKELWKGQEDYRQGKKYENKPSKNFHPTVKPIALMEYLVKLVTRENALVLDPFGGSGTTGIACKNLGRNFILIEREPDYVNIAETRINAFKIL